MHQALGTLINAPERPVGTGGFLDPESVAGNFGIKEGMKISDFGCGAGYLTIIMAEKVGSTGLVYALDVQEGPLEMVASKARASNLANIQTIRANLEVLGSSKLEDKTQDIVLLANILFQSNKKPEIIKEADRVLMDGGQMIVIDWNKGTNGFGPPNELRLGVDEVIAMVEKNGLKLVRKIDAGNYHFGLIFKK